MKLTDIRIGTPMLKIETRVFHATPRKPTAFERVILSMAGKFGDDATYNNIPLEHLFVDLLRVADPAPIVTPTLAELIALDVIRCLNDIDSLGTLILRDIEITERGRAMIEKDMLPAKSMQNDEAFFYDPINSRLLSQAQSKAYRPVPPHLSLDATVFEEVFPEARIRSKVQAGDYSWFGSASEIERLERLKTEILWKDTSCSIMLDSGKLTIVTDDEGLNTYIGSLDSEEVYNRFIAPVFAYGDLQPEAFPEFAGDDLESPERTFMPVQQVLSQWPDDDRVVITAAGDDDPSMPEKAPPRQAVVIYRDGIHEDDMHFEWNEDRNGFKLIVGATHPDPDCLRLTDQHETRCHSVLATYRGVCRRLLVACQSTLKSLDEATGNPLAYLTDLFNQRAGREERCGAVLWEGEARHMENALRWLAHSTPRLEDLVSAFYARLADTERVNGSIDRDAWDELLFKFICDKIDACEEVTLDAWEGLLQILSEHPPLNQKHAFGLLHAFSQKVVVPHTLNELKTLTAALRNLDPSWSLGYPSRLFTPELIRSLFVAFPVEIDPALFSAGNALLTPLSSLNRLYGELSSLIGDNGLEDLVADEDYAQLLKDHPDGDLTGLAHSWLLEMESLSSAIENFETASAGTYLESLGEKVANISDWSAKLIGTVGGSFRSVYVFDTSALIDQPGIAAGIRPDEMCVVSKRVIEELDDKKLDEELRPSVSEAVRNLRRIEKEQIQFCDGDMSLLTEDYRLKGDNLILSVAVRFRKHKPTLVTNDNNLSLRAQAEGIAVMTSKDFEQRKRSPQKNTGRPQHGYSQSLKGNQGKTRGRK
jgi:rRNA-processing protein FCF1